MKKRNLFLISVLLTATSLFAVGFNFEVLPSNALYEKHIADTWSPSLGLDYMFMIENGPSTIGVITEREEGKVYPNDNPDESKHENIVYELFPFRDEEIRTKYYYRFTLAEQLPVVRFSYGDYALEGFANGGFNMIFEGSGATDIIGFDGFFFIGGSASLHDRVFIKAGVHHYSGHLGDEVVTELAEEFQDRLHLPDGTPGKIYDLERFVRQNSLILGITADILPWLRVYAEADLLFPKMRTIRPWAVIPNGIIRRKDKDTGLTMDQIIGYQEGSRNLNRKNTYPDSYRDRILQFGTEFYLPVENLGNAVLAFDTMLYESGKTKYQIGSYSDVSPWEKDINVLLGFDFAKSGLSMGISYHSGRFPLTEFFFHHCSYVSVGLSLSPR